MDSGRLRFGLFEFDTVNRELRREGSLVPRQMQPAQVLSCLIGQQGAVVSREHLFQAVWGPDTHVDFERGLNFCIAQIRAALGDDSTAPRYIRTISKREYQFLVPVEQVLVAAEQPKSLSRLTAMQARVLAASCAALLIVMSLYAGFRLWLGMRSTHSPVVAVVRFDNETGDPGLDRFSDGLTDDLAQNAGGESFLPEEGAFNFGPMGSASAVS